VEDDTVEIKFTNPLGTGLSQGNVAASSALGRPFKRLFESGKPVEKLTYIYFQPPQGPLRTLGSLCHSAGGRVVFYPGLTTGRPAVVTFEFWICRNPKERRHEVVVPIAPPAVAEPLSLPTELRYRGHDIMIPGLSTRFSVNAYKLVGTLAEEAIISCRAGRPAVED